MPSSSSTVEAAVNATLSSKDIPARDRLIFALDFSTIDEAKVIVTTLSDSVTFYKLGLGLFMAGGYWEMVAWLKARNKRVFVDLKFFDIPETVRGAVKQLSSYHADFASVHGNDGILRSACEAKNGVKILAVTVLTSLDESDLKDLGFKVDTKTLVLSRARRALEIGCDGVISSGLEVPELRRDLGDGFLIVVPGIRPVKNRPVDDQKRTVDVEEAFNRGADYIVVGRPIRDASDPKAAAEDIQKRISALFP
jgi:orotidine-5'-phosphate decarboxylase